MEKDAAARNGTPMPEMPEVETIRRMLAPLVEGTRLVAARTSGKPLRTPVPDLAPLCGARLRRLDRRGKWLVWRFAGDRVLLQHLGMTGAWFPRAHAPAAHRHLELDWERVALAYHDPRRFGMLVLADARTARARLAPLGPEPTSISGAALAERAGGSRRSLHAALLDGRVVAGIGNIYASEACFHAGLDPRAPCRSLAARDWARLAAAVRATIRAALAAGGTTIRDFLHPDGRPGYFHRHLAVYGRAGAPCPRCGEPVRRLRLGGRSAYACPRCQQMPEGAASIAAPPVQEESS